MKLREFASKLFSRGPRTDFRSTTTYTGNVNHSVYDEDEDHTYRWQSGGHPVYLQMKKNEFGSYNIVQHMKFGWGWKPQVLREHLSQQEAVNLMLDREVYVLREFGGFSKGLTYQDVHDKIEAGGYKSDHIFAHVKANPDAFKGWVRARTAEIQAPKKPATAQKP